MRPIDQAAPRDARKVFIPPKAISSYMAKLTRATRADPRTICRVHIMGKPTSFKIALPFSFTGNEILGKKIGAINLNQDPPIINFLKPLPASWLVDLNADSAVIAETVNDDDCPTPAPAQKATRAQLESAARAMLQALETIPAPSRQIAEAIAEGRQALGLSTPNQPQQSQGGTHVDVDLPF